VCGGGAGQWQSASWGLLEECEWSQVREGGSECECFCVRGGVRECVCEGVSECVCVCEGVCEWGVGVVSHA
jgi:hypothetical protein